MALVLCAGMMFLLVVIGALVDALTKHLKRA